MSNELTHQSEQFGEILGLIDKARNRAMQVVNAELIRMYWEIGNYVSDKVKDGGWGKSIVADFFRVPPSTLSGHEGILLAKHLAHEAVL